MITDIKDRVPQNPGRRLVEPENGGAPFYATITRADNAIEPGSKINRELLEEIGTMQAEAVNNDGVIEITAASGASRIVFTAPSDFSDTDTYTLNGSELTLQQTNGQALSTAWVEGAPVELTIVGAVGFFKGGGGGRKRRGEIEVTGRALMDIKLDDAVMHQVTGSWETGASAVPDENITRLTETTVAVEMTKNKKFIITGINANGFKANGSGQSRIYIFKQDNVDPDKYTFLKTVASSASWGITDLKLSPDETKIITTHYYNSATYTNVHLWSFDNESGEMTQLSNVISAVTASGYVAWSVAWHPDSQEVCISWSTGTGVTASYYDRLIIISIASNGDMTYRVDLISQLANLFYRFYDLDYSPDGRFIAAARYISTSSTAGNRAFLFKSTGVQYQYSDVTNSLPDNPQTGTNAAVKFGANNVDLIFAAGSYASSRMYTRLGDAFTKRPNPAIDVPNAYAVDIDPSSSFAIIAGVGQTPVVYFIPPDPTEPLIKMPDVLPLSDQVQYAVKALVDRFVIGRAYNAVSPFGPLMMYTTETQEILQPWRNLGMTHKWLPPGYGGFANQNIPAQTIGKSTVYEQLRG